MPFTVLQCVNKDIIKKNRTVVALFVIGKYDILSLLPYFTFIIQTF